MPPKANSRYQFCRAYKDDEDRWYLEVPYPFRFTNEVDSTPYIVKEGDTLQILAYRFFRGEEHSPQLWRAIAEFNDIIDATIPLETGKQIMIPSLRWLKEVYHYPPDSFRFALADIQRSNGRM